MITSSISDMINMLIELLQISFGFIGGVLIISVLVMFVKQLIKEPKFDRFTWPVQPPVDDNPHRDLCLYCGRDPGRGMSCRNCGAPNDD